MDHTPASRPKYIVPVALVGFVVLVGCEYSLMTFVGPGASTMTPQQFSNNPILRRLAEAVDLGDDAAIAAAVHAGADVNALGTGGFRLLYWAMARGNAKGFEELLKQGATLEADYRDPEYLPDISYNDTVLEHVLGCQDTRFLEAALRQGLDPNYIPHQEDQFTLLFIAVLRHSVPAIRVLCAAGAEINRQETSGYTPLIMAGMGRSYNEAWALLVCGADPTVCDHLGHGFVWELKQYGSRGVRPDQRKSFEEVVDELVKRGLLTHQDIIEADKPKRSVLNDGPPGITVIEHSPDSEAGQAILELDRLKREASRREQR